MTIYELFDSNLVFKENYMLENRNNLSFSCTDIFNVELDGQLLPIGSQIDHNDINASIYD